MEPSGHGTVRTWEPTLTLLELSHTRCEVSSFWNVHTANPEDHHPRPQVCRPFLRLPWTEAEVLNTPYPNTQRRTLLSITFRNGGSTDSTPFQAARFLWPVWPAGDWAVEARRVSSGLITPSHHSSKALLLQFRCSNLRQVCKGGWLTVGVQDLQLCLWKGELGAAPLVQVVSRGRQLVVELGLYESNRTCQQSHAGF
jgi:hypothetical protein